MRCFSRQFSSALSQSFFLALPHLGNFDVLVRGGFYQALFCRGFFLALFCSGFSRALSVRVFSVRSLAGCFAGSLLHRNLLCSVMKGSVHSVLPQGFSSFAFLQALSRALHHMGFTPCSLSSGSMLLTFVGSPSALSFARSFSVHSLCGVFTVRSLARASSVRAPSPSENQSSWPLSQGLSPFSVHSSAKLFRDYFRMGFFRLPFCKVLSHLLTRKGFFPCTLSQGFCRVVFESKFFRAHFHWEFLRSLPCRGFFRMLSPRGFFRTLLRLGFLRWCSLWWGRLPCLHLQDLFPCILFARVSPQDLFPCIFFARVSPSVHQHGIFPFALAVRFSVRFFVGSFSVHFLAGFFFRMHSRRGFFSTLLSVDFSP